MIERLEPRQLQVMQQLAKYKFLDYVQILTELRIYKYRSNLSTAMKALRERKRPLIRKIPHGVGSSATLYLTKFGMEVLCKVRADQYTPENVQYLKRVLYTDTQDSKHRSSTISIQIALDQACTNAGIPILLSERYIDTTGNRRRDNNLASKTAIEVSQSKSITADLVFILQTPAQKELYLVELENGYDHGKTIEKLIDHGKALLASSANKKYDHTHTGYRTLWVFEHETTMLGAMKRMQASSFFTNLFEFFLFSTIENIASDFWGGWVTASGESRNLYYI